MNRILCSLLCAITGVLLLTGFPAHGTNRFPAEAPRVKESAISPDFFFRVFVAKNPIYLILVEKDKQRLRLLKYEGNLRVVAEYPCATGENAGKKIFNGDSRTPEGIYFITKIYTDNKVTIFGKRAFHLDFPNIFDKDLGRNGDGIYIHGTNRGLKPMSTNGCITLRNKDLDELVRFLETDATPVVIIPGIRALKGAETVKFDESRLDLVKILLLSDEIRRDQAEFEYLYLLTDGIQTVAVGEFTLYQNEYPIFQGYSRSYLALNREKGWTNKERIHRVKPLQSGQLLPRYPKDKQKILEFIETWRKAWQSKDMETYIGCYAKSFRRDRMDRVAYGAYKDRLKNKYKFIKVDISGVSVSWTRTGANVSFKQDYRSDRYYAMGRKTLRLAYGNQRWGIEREIWFRSKTAKRVRQ